MWFVLFASLGANFLDYGFWSDPWQWGFIVCGVVFELMAFPALYFLLPIAGTSMWTPTDEAAPGARAPEQGALVVGLPRRSAPSARPSATSVWDALK